MQYVSPHRHIVQLMGQAMYGKDLYLLTEYINGGDLSNINISTNEEKLW